jgi:zinc transporter ZupT
MSDYSAAPVAAYDDGDNDDDQTNVGIAFAVTCGAGAATALGAAVVFVPSLVRYGQRRTLAGALGLAAGVMIYVSFIEIFQKSRNSFVDSGLDDDTAYIYATLSFFGGVIFMMVRRKRTFGPHAVFSGISHPCLLSVFGTFQSSH